MNAINPVRPYLEHCICPGDEDDITVPRSDDPRCPFHGKSAKAQLRQLSQRARELQRSIDQLIGELP